MMRIITGKARGVRLLAPEGENTRPTAERAKEAVFSMLQFEMEDRQVLDLFAGSGQLGLEALSRGAAHAVFVDSDRAAAEVIRKNTLKTRLAPDCEIFCLDYPEFLRSLRGKRQFDLIFLDPPYVQKRIPDALRQLKKYRAFSPNATVVCESAGAEDVFGGDRSLEALFEVRRETHYGVACVTVLTWRGEACE